jgi:hypothetical protein
MEEKNLVEWYHGKHGAFPLEEVEYLKKMQSGRDSFCMMTQGW